MKIAIFVSLIFRSFFKDFKLEYFCIGFIGFILDKRHGQDRTSVFGS